MGGYKSCPPFRAWNRLEPRTRTYEFDRNLKAAVHDPLWYLTRQWQFGEFKGEDTGSPILAKVLVQTSKINTFKSYEGNLENYTDDSPLEMQVEQMPLEMGYKERVQAGNYWLKILRHFGEDYNNSQPSRPYKDHLYRSRLLNRYPLSLPKIESEDVAIVLQQAKLDTNKRLQNYVRQFAGKIPDGGLIYQAIQQSTSNFTKKIRFTGAHQNLLNRAINDFLAWFERMYPELELANRSWNARQLSYQFHCALPEKGENNTVLVADDYSNGRLDWYAFDVEEDKDKVGDLLESGGESVKNEIKEQLFSFIPTPAVFAGMPNNRWWAFEDGHVDLGNINAETTDISKIVLVEFAAMYGNNWFLLPYEIPAGTLSEVKGIVVTDVFGQKTLVKSAIQGDSSDWSAWGLFNLTKRKTDPLKVADSDTRLFIPPTLSKSQNGKPIEEVLLLRDEMANLVWAIETKINDLTKSGMDAYLAAEAFSKYINDRFAASKAVETAQQTAILQYLLSNSVPENWIPFVAIHLGTKGRAIQLQRASMPRSIEGKHLPIRPRTQLLREGLGNPSKEALAPYVHPEADEQTAPYYLHEEEVPRSGVRIKAGMQRARWYHGKVFKWYAYRKTMGKGEGNSGLAFDQVKFLRNQ